MEEGEKCSRRHAQKSSGEGDPNPVLNRVDLISRTIATLERLNREKEDCRARVTEISQAGNDIAAARQAIKDDRVSARLTNHDSLNLLYALSQFLLHPFYLCRCF